MQNCLLEGRNCEIIHRWPLCRIMGRFSSLGVQGVSLWWFCWLRSMFEMSQRAVLPCLLGPREGGCLISEKGKLDQRFSWARGRGQQVGPCSMWPPGKRRKGMARGLQSRHSGMQVQLVSVAPTPPYPSPSCASPAKEGRTLERVVRKGRGWLEGGTRGLGLGSQLRNHAATRMDLWNKWVFPEDLWKHVEWGTGGGRGVLDLLHVEWNFFSWALKERITLNAEKLGDSWIILVTLTWETLDLVLGYWWPPSKGEADVLAASAGSIPPVSGGDQEHLCLPFISDFRGPAQMHKLILKAKYRETPGVSVRYQGPAHWQLFCLSKALL